MSDSHDADAGTATDVHSAPTAAPASDGGVGKALRYIGLGVLVVALGLGLAFLVASWRTGGNDTGELKPGQSQGGVVPDIGPVNGRDLPSYVTERKAALGQAQGPRVAVVSFSKYETESEARAMFGKADVVALLAAAPGGTPSVVKGSLNDWVDQQKEAAKNQKAEIQKMMPTVDDPEFKQFYTQELARLDGLTAKISATGPVVFGAVVREPAKALQDLDHASGVRLVDVGDSSKASSKDNYHGLRPEETVKAGDPATRPL